MKMVCTSLRPVRPLSSVMRDLEGISNFVADWMSYEPPEHSAQPSSTLVAPDTVLKAKVCQASDQHQCGHVLDNRPRLTACHAGVGCKSPLLNTDRLSVGIHMHGLYVFGTRHVLAHDSEFKEYQPQHNSPSCNLTCPVVWQVGKTQGRGQQSQSDPCCNLISRVWDTCLAQLRMPLHRPLRLKSGRRAHPASACLPAMPSGAQTGHVTAHLCWCRLGTPLTWPTCCARCCWAQITTPWSWSATLSRCACSMVMIPHVGGFLLALCLHKAMPRV